MKVIISVFLVLTIVISRAQPMPSVEEKFSFLVTFQKRQIKPGEMMILFKQFFL